MKQYQNITSVKKYIFFGHFDATSNRFLAVNNRRDFWYDIRVWLFETRENINSHVGYIFCFHPELLMDYSRRACFIGKHNRRRKRLNDTGSLGHQKVFEHINSAKCSYLLSGFFEWYKKKKTRILCFISSRNRHFNINACGGKKKNILNRDGKKVLLFWVRVKH